MRGSRESLSSSEEEPNAGKVNTGNLKRTLIKKL